MMVVVGVVLTRGILDLHHLVHGGQVLLDHLEEVGVEDPLVVVAHSSPSQEGVQQDEVVALVLVGGNPFLVGHDEVLEGDLANGSFEEEDHVVVLHVDLHGDHHDLQVDPEVPVEHLEDLVELDSSNLVAAAVAARSV